MVKDSEINSSVLGSIAASVNTFNSFVNKSINNGNNFSDLNDGGIVKLTVNCWIVVGRLLIVLLGTPIFHQLISWKIHQ